jgi:hypothetical protein
MDSSGSKTPSELTPLTGQNPRKSTSFDATLINSSPLTTRTHTVLALIVTACLKTSRSRITGHSGTCATITSTCAIAVKLTALLSTESAAAIPHNVFERVPVDFTFLTP